MADSKCVVGRTNALNIKNNFKNESPEPTNALITAERNRMKKTEKIIFKNTNKKRSRSVEGHAPVTDCLTPCLFIFITLMPELKFVQLYL